MVHFLRAVPEDAPLLAATRQKAWASTYRGIYPDSMIDEFDFQWHTERERMLLQRDWVHTHLVMDGAECLGYFTYLIREEPLWRDYHARLFSLYLLPELRGRGLGRQILELVRGECRRAGYSRLYLSCAPQNTPAMEFYRHMGGRIVAEDVGNEHPEEDTVDFEFDC